MTNEEIKAEAKKRHNLETVNDYNYLEENGSEEYCDELLSHIAYLKQHPNYKS